MDEHTNMVCYLERLDLSRVTLCSSQIRGKIKMVENRRHTSVELLFSRVYKAFYAVVFP